MKGEKNVGCYFLSKETNTGCFHRGHIKHSCIPTRISTCLSKFDLFRTNHITSKTAACSFTIKSTNKAEQIQSNSLKLALIWIRQYSSYDVYMSCRADRILHSTPVSISQSITTLHFQMQLHPSTLWMATISVKTRSISQHGFLMFCAEIWWSRRYQILWQKQSNREYKEAQNKWQMIMIVKKLLIISEPGSSGAWRN